jgi:hypothetical protein
MIPAPHAIGELPPGIHTATLAEVEAVFVTTPRRRRLFEGLRRALQNLHAAGVSRILIDGSFVTTKADPNDVDGCWEWTEAVDLDLLDPVLTGAGRCGTPMVSISFLPPGSKPDRG